ncbi:ecdysteroid 22-kinase family protein [Phenylobacterium aquaticum]|uniref:ecdysteroid 22-kinase family protein n=1 Tax=Phenylobacterium aquaticum TaxID=1763816 RepID=UPI001F5D1784|nr:ecdysteroid 22-kinase family protein [Phenylobacterium aquaticum]MCI3132105.1 ecdysteroid 22-kinase family protein [Phenylobacterium aquaticum]
MTKPAIAASPAGIDADWMTQALRASGAIKDSRVTAITAKPVGNGLVGDSFRFQLTYDTAEAGAPASVVGKFPAEDPSSRASGAAHQLYRKEVSFYRELAHTVKINTPKAHFADINLETQDFTLIFEDLGPSRPGDQLTGCSVEDAETAMLEAAALHGPRWGDPVLPTIDWLNTGKDLAPHIVGAMPMVIAAYRERYDGLLEPEYMAIVERLPQIMGGYYEPREIPLTVQHGDYRLDNILFDVQGGKARQGTLDWQTVSCGPGLTDVSYFLSAGLPFETRRKHEQDLVRRYHDELLTYGVKDYSWETCWEDYRRYAVHGVFMGVFSAIAVERTERGDELFLKMTRGGCAQALDHDTFSFWG